MKKHIFTKGVVLEHTNLKAVEKKQKIVNIKNVIHMVFFTVFSVFSKIFFENKVIPLSNGQKILFC